MSEPVPHPADAFPDLPLDPDEPEQQARPLHLHPSAILLVLLGGVVGTAVRHGVGQLLPGGDGRWPAGTFVVNLVGAFVLGTLLEALTRLGPDTGWRRRSRLALGTGFCGSLTTYSTFAVEVVEAVRGGHGGLAVAYPLVSLVAGIVLCLAGIGVAAGTHRRRTATREVA